MTQHSMPRANQHIIIHLVPPRKKISKHIKTGTWKLSLGGGAKWELHLMDGLTGLNLSSPPKKGCHFGKSRASDFVRLIPENTLLTKVLNHYLELIFCRQCHLSTAIPNLWYLSLEEITYCFNFAKLFQWKSLEVLWQASWIWSVITHFTL